jgi:hypothetical protein
MITGCHASIVLREEEDKLWLEDLALIKGVGRKVKLRITGIRFHQKVKETNRVEFMVLSVESETILQIRQNLRRPRHPEKLNLHISLFERLI